MSSTDGGNVGSNMLDLKNTKKAKTGEANFPWVQVDLGRRYRVTKVALLSGEEPILNMDVRIGCWICRELGIQGSHPMIGGDCLMNPGCYNVDSIRCGVYYGPTLVTQQWVEVDCGYTKGMLCQFITIQMTERFMVNNPLENTMLEVYGWGRVCGTENP